MGKKYLVYIHSPQFDNEEKKSSLINKLLENYYAKKPSPPVRTKETKFGDTIIVGKK